MSAETSSQIFEYESIARVVFGPEACKQTGAEACNLTQGKNALIITDAGVMQAGLIGEIETSLAKSDFAVSICADVAPEPTVSDFESVLAEAKDKSPDVLIGVGGGSSLDVSKVVARGLTNAGDLEDYVGEEWNSPGIPLITIPTTAGTAAEVTPDAVVRLPDEKVKSGFIDVRASVAIVDPTLTLSLPPRLTAATGLDALSHAIESALSKIATPLTHALALESIRLISENLRTAVSNGRDLEARTNMAWATLIEGFSEGNAADVEGHAIAHVLGGYYTVHHGEACAIALPFCMKYNLPVNTPILARIARAMDTRISGIPEEMAVKGIHAVRQLIDDVGGPSRITDIEAASRDGIPEMVDLYLTNPNITEFFEEWCRRGIPTEAEATALFQEMFEPEFRLP
ncbi:MAG: iron-containing alcohol dehydrogenase [Deltaproteobacteria bacterium]|jgi:alcohol dehydrogenase|nr:iron-containing alcohol dehydrogenase [Deltaproteobacteria bacterium]